MKSARRLILLLIGNVMFGLGQYIVVFAIARAMSKAALADFSLAFAATTVIFTFFAFQLRDIIYNRLDYKSSASQYLGTRLVSCVAATILSCLWVFVLRQPELLPLYLAVCAIKTFEGMQEISMVGAISEQRIVQMTVMQTSSALIKAAMVFVGVKYLHLNLTGLVAAVAVGALVVPLITTAKDGWPSFHFIKDRSWHREILVNGVQLGLASVLDAAVSASPRFLLDKVLGKAALADFTTIMLLYLAMGQTVGLLLSQSVIREFSILVRENNLARIRKRVRFLVTGMAAFTVVLTAILYPTGRPIMLAIFGSHYAEVGSLMWVVALASGVWLIAGVMSCSALAFRLYTVSPVANFCMLVVVLVSVFLLLKPLGVLGAVIGVMLGTATRGAVLLFEMVRRRSFWEAPGAPPDAPAAA